MNYQSKTKEELIKELQKLEDENKSLKSSYDLEISEHIRIENTLRKSEIRLSTMFEDAPLGIALIDSITGRIYEVNQMFAKIAGRTIEKMATIDWISITHPDDIQEDLDNMALLLKGKIEGFHMEKRYIRPDGSIVWINMTISHIIKEENMPLCHLCMIEDITERKRTEELLRLSEEKYRTIIDNIGEGIAFLNPDEQFIFANHAAEKIFGVGPGNLEGMNLNQFIAPEQYNLIQMETAKRSQGENSVYELAILPHNGESRIIVVTAVPQIDQKRGFLGTYGVFRDITERKEDEAEINLINEQLEKLNVEKDKFFSIIAHDIRSPFNGFLGLTEIMANDLHQMTLEEIKGMSLLLNKSAANLYDLLGNLLEWSRIQRGLIIFSPESFLLFSRIVEWLAAIVESAREKEIYFNLNIPADLLVVTDAKILECIVRNLTNNAVKFTPKGGQIIVSANTSVNNFIEISIKDTGLGMSKQMINNLFRLDINTGRKGTEGEPSNGMGLIICKDLIEKQGGELHIESEEGKGSEFKFTIPFNN
jgi:PAS domain S-box-containing protein